MRIALRIAICFAVFLALSYTTTAQTVVSQHLLLVDPTTGHMIKLQVPALSGPLTLNLPTTNGTLITTANGWALGGNDLSLAGPLQNQIGSTSASMTDVDLIAGGDIKLRVGATTGLVSLLDATGLAFQDGDETNVSTFTAGDQTANINYTLPTTQPAANDVLTATAVSGSGPYDVTLGWTGSIGRAVLSADISNIEDDVYAEMTDFKLAVEANTTYEVFMYLYNENVSGARNTDLQFTFPSGSMNVGATVYNTGAFTVSSSPATLSNLDTDTNPRLVIVHGILTIGATGGDLQTYFKMNSGEDGTRTVTFKTGSHLLLRKL